MTAPIRYLALCLAIIVVSLAGSRPATAFFDKATRIFVPDIGLCEKSGNRTPDQRIAHCDKALNLPKALIWVNRASLHFGRGTARLHKGDLERALADLQEAIRLDPTAAPAYNNRGIIYNKKGDAKRALADFSQSLSLNPDSADTLVNRADIYIQFERFHEAEDDLGKAIQLDPNSANTHRSRAFLYQKSEQFNRAIEAAGMALKHDPSHVAAYFIRGQAYLNLGKLDAGLENFNQAVRLAPNNFDYRLIRGLLHLESGKLDAAIADLSALRIATSKPFQQQSVLSARGRAFMLKKMYDPAIADLDRAAKLNSEDAETFLSRARAHQGKKDYHRAAADYETAARLAPNAPEITLHRGILFSDLKQFDKAIEAVTSALVSRAIPAESRALGLAARGVAYAAKSRYRLALKDYLAASKIMPEDPELVLRSGQSLVAVRGFKEAISLTDKFLAKKTAHPDHRLKAHQIRAKAYAGMAQYQRASAELQAALRVKPHEPALLFDYASNLAKLHQHEKMLEPLGKIIASKTAPQLLRAEARVMRSEINVGLGDRSAAVKDLKTAYDSVKEKSPLSRKIGKTMWRIGMTKDFGACANSVQRQNWKTVLRQCTKAIEAGELPRLLTGMAHHYRCLAHMRGRSYRLALTECSATVLLRPKYADGHYTRGNANVYLRNFRDAVRDYSVVLKLQPENARAAVARGQAYGLLKEYYRSIADLTLAIRLGQFLPVAYDRRGIGYMRLRQYRKALPDFDEAIRLAPNSSGTYVNRGIVNGQLKRFDAAAKDFQAAIDAGHKAPHQMLFNMGLAFQRSNQLEKAAEHFKKSLKLAPYFAPARTALQKLGR